MNKATEGKAPDKSNLATFVTLEITERLLHQPDILITMNVDLMELVLQMFIFHIGHVIDHFQDYKPRQHREYQSFLNKEETSISLNW